MSERSIKYRVLSSKPRAAWAWYLILYTLYFFTGTVQAQDTLNLKFFIEGYYLSGGMMQQVLYNEGVDPNPFSTLVDTAVVELHDSLNPCVNVPSFKGVFNTNGTMTCNFPASVSGHSYYIAVRHRNSILTWSSAPVMFTSSTSYDFTSGSMKAYATNMTRVEANVWAFYSGDINQDRNIDLSDVPVLDFGIISGLYGYYASDLNGDGNVDLVDFPILDQNITRGVFAMSPPFSSSGVTPSVSIHATQDTICSSTPVTFTATAVNPGGSPIYQWKLNGNNVGTNSTVYSNSSLADQDVVKCIMTSSCVCASSPTATSNSITMTVKPYTNPYISGTLSFCTGGTTTLDAGSGYSTYTWSPGGQTTPIISVNSAGTYSVTVTVANICSGTASAVVQLFAAPVISGNLSFCPQAGTILSAGSYGTYLWSPGGQTTQSINVTSAGTYSVAVTDPGSCTATSLPVTTTIHTLASDINVDGVVDINDFSLFVGSFNSTCSSCREDINRDGIVNIDDYLILLGDFGKSCH